MTTLNIDKQVLLHNINVIKNLSDKSEIIAVVKGNAYGLGLCPFAKLLEQTGISHFAVTDLADAITLRECCIQGEILMLTPIYEHTLLCQAVKHNITLSITSKACGTAAENVALELSKTARAHLCIDTGFGRYGFLDSNIDEIVETVEDMNHIQITGIFSHFYGSNCKNPIHVEKQYHRFLNVCDTLSQKHISIGMRHIASTSSFLRFPETKLDAIRIGSAFLGRLPFPDKWGFAPIGELEASIDDIYTLPAGHNVGYGNTYTTSKPTTIAVVSAGYYHGLGLERQTQAKPAKLTPINILRSMKHYFFRKEITAALGAHHFHIIGRVGMNSLILDITGFSLSVGDHVTFPINPLYVNSSIPRSYLEYCSVPSPCEVTDEEMPAKPHLLKVI